MGIFEPFRTLGLITDGVPFAVQRRGTETFVTLSIGKSWQTFNCAKLSLVFAGPQMENKIRALASYRDYTFAAVGSDIIVFRRAHQVATWSEHSEKITYLLVFGDHVYSVDVKGNLFLWKFKEKGDNSSPTERILLEDNFSPTCIMHPETYTDKIIMGSQQGSLQLWNISTKKKLYEFKGWGSPVYCCVSSPALDVVAVGCADGKIHVHNVRFDEELFTFTHSSRGAVTSLSFSTDGQPLLASGASSGIISIWNLEKRRLHSVIRDAHDTAVTSLHFLANEPVLMSSASDNSVKMWIFDTSDEEARLLRFRSGHSAAPRCIRFYKSGRHILSAGMDRAFRMFSVVKDQQSRELSQHNVSKRAKLRKVKDEEIKLKPVVSFDFAEIRERDWCNVVTCHMDTPQAYVWRLQNFVLGEHILSPSLDYPSPVKACTISACGNFAVLGTERGWVERFNLQSGHARGSYSDVSEANKYAHSCEVVSIACDSSNSHLITAGYLGDIKVWDFKERTLKSKWNIGCSLVKFVYHRGNGLLATAGDDIVVRVYDVIAQRMVRLFKGHTDRITDLCFSEDGKWLLSSSMDGSLRTFDVILGGQVDAVTVDIPITALSLSPNMDFLATSQVDQNGIHLWVNQMLFSVSRALEVSSNREGLITKAISLSEKSSSEDSANNSHEPPTNILQILDLVTLSLLPKSQWQSLVNLDIIKARNKPIEPPKKSERAPFFLPSVPSLSGDVIFKTDASANGDDEENVKANEVKQGLGSEKISPFLLLLGSCSKVNAFESFTKYIKGLSPSSLDLELRVLQITGDDLREVETEAQLTPIGLLLDYFIHELSQNNNFEFIQATIRLFLTIHGETVRCQPTLLGKAKKLAQIQSSVWERVDRMFQSTRCMVTFLSNSQL